MQPLQNCINPTIRIGQEILCLLYAGFLLPTRTAMKAHMHDEHMITIFEDINIDMYGGFRNYKSLMGFKIKIHQN